MLQKASTPKMTILVLVIWGLLLAVSGFSYEINSDVNNEHLQSLMNEPTSSNLAQGAATLSEMQYVLLAPDHRAVSLTINNVVISATYPITNIDGLSDILPTEPLSLVGSARMARYNLATLAYNPMYYDADNNNIVVISGVNFDIESQEAEFEAEPRRQTEATDRFVSDHCIGYDQQIWAYEALPETREKSDVTASLFPDLLSTTVPYVIITDPNLAPAFADYVDYKTMQGYYTKVVDLDWIKDNFNFGAEIPDNVREFIKYAYQEWGTQYILLGGGHEIIPTKLIWSNKLGGDYIPSDYFYSCLDGNWNEELDEYVGLVPDNVDFLPEVFVGRIPVSATSEVTNYLNKLIQYETDNQFTAYQQKALFLGALISYKGDSQWIVDELDGLTPAGFSSTKMLEFIGDQEQPYTKQDFLDAFNAGNSVFFAYAHTSGSNNLIIRKDGDRVYFTGEDADLLTNYGMYPIYSSVSCHNNDITHDCLSIHLMNNPVGGAIGYIGSPALDAGYASFRYYTEIFDNIYQSTTDKTIGEITTMAHLVNSSRGADIDGLTRQSLLSYMYLGDPTLYAWSDAPSEFQVSYPSTITKGDQTITVNVSHDAAPVEGAMVTLRYQDLFYANAVTNASGDASFTLTVSSNDDISIGVTKKNFWHFTGTIGVVDNNSYVTLDGISYRDDSTAVSAGNNNGIIEAGEQIAVAMTLTNTGGTQLDNVILYMADNEADVSFNVNNMTITSIAPGETVVTDYVMNFNVDPAVSDIQYLEGVMLEVLFNLTVVDFPLRIPVAGGVPEISGYAIDDSNFGNGDNCLGGFEDIRFPVTISNAGKGTMEDVWARLIPDNQMWAMFDPGVDSIFFGDIPPNKSVTGDPYEFYFVAAENLATYVLEVHDIYNNIYSLPIVAECNTDIIDSVLFRCYSDGIKVTWYNEDNTDIDGYNIYRRTATTDFEKVNDRPITTSTYFMDENLNSDTHYFYKVELLKNNMATGPMSDEYETATNPLMPNFWPAQQAAWTSTPLIAPIEPSYYYRTTFIGHENDIYWFNCVGAPKSSTCPIFASLDEGGNFQWNMLSGEDVNNDGKYDVLATSSGTDAKIYAFQNDGNTAGGSPLVGWPISLDTGDKSMFSPVSIADVDHDGDYELFAVSTLGAMYAMNYDGTPLIGSSANFYTMPEGSWTYSGVALGDVTGNGQLEIVVTATYNYSGLHDRYLYVFDLSGNILTNFPVSISNEGMLSTPVLADFDNDGNGLEILVNNNMEKYHIVDSDGSILFSWPDEPFGSKQIIYSVTMPSVIDVNDDGILEIVGIIYDQLFIVDQSGNFVDGWPKTMKNIVITDFVNNPLVGDIDGDDDFEIVLNYGSSLYAYETDGSQVPGYPIDGGAGGIPSITPMVSYNDLHLASGTDEIDVWNLNDTYDGYEMAWPVYGHDSHRTHNVFGSKPFLYSFSCPSSMTYSATTTITATIQEYDERWGDELTYVWSCNKGYITGTGSSVTYTAPGYTTTATITFKAFDKGGNTITKQRNISISSGSSGGSCPFVYVKTENGFEIDNTILTQSEAPENRGRVVTDFYKLEKQPFIENGTATLEIREIEFERSYLDQLSLLLVEVPDDLDLVFTSNGDNAYISPSAGCTFTATTNEGDITELVSLIDANTYIGYGPINMNVDIPAGADYDDLLVNIHLNKDSELPGPKAIHGITKPNGLADSFTPVKLSAFSDKTGPVDIAAAPRVYPSTISFKIPRDIVELGTLTFSWQTKLDIDQIDITPALDKEVILSEVVPVKAELKGKEVALDKILSSDHDFVNLMPNESIQLRFSGIPDAPMGTHYEFVFRSNGYYTSFDDKEDHTLLPDTPELFQNYPNPFNPETVIPFSLPAAGKVRIDVINILGQHVRTLLDEEVQSGYNTVQWNSENDNGSQVASGIYFIRMQFGEHVKTMSLQLVK